MNAPKALLFDFDGTIADTFELAVGIFNQLSREFDFRPVRDDEIPAARKMGARQIMQEYGIPSSRLPRVAHKGLKLLHAKMAEVQPFSGVVPMLLELRRMGFRLGMLTSNSEENVTLFLQRHGIEVFDFIRPSSRLFGKAREIRSILKANNWQPREVVYVGDECRDIEAAQKARIRMLAVSWGFNTPDALAALGPDALVACPTEIVPLFQPRGLFA